MLLITDRTARLLPTLSLVFVLSACGGGGGGSQPPSTPDPAPNPPPTFSVEGMAVKGPLQNAQAILYMFDSSQPNGIGDQVDTGTTNAQARLQGIEVTGDVDDFYILEVNATDGSTDLTTGEAPVISTLRTLVRGADLEDEESVFATPLSTMTLGLALAEDASDFATALVDAEVIVKSLFDLEEGVDIFRTPPVLTSETTTLSDQVRSSKVRMASELVVALAFLLHTDLGDETISVDDVLATITRDIADGTIDGKASDEDLSYGDRITALFDQGSQLEVPNTSGRRVSEVSLILVEEKVSTGNSSVDTIALEQAGTVSFNPSRVVDADSDGISNLKDSDDDGDGVADVDDAFPLDPSETVDTDSDGIGNNADTDDDGDGTDDEQDAFPLDPNETTDTDQDGRGNNADADDDGDGVDDFFDAFPLDQTETRDVDGDGFGDNADTDDDNDGIPDEEDIITLFGQKTTYSPGEETIARVRGRDENGARLTAAEGWHVQYQIFDVGDNDRHLTQYEADGFFNADFDAATSEWVIAYPAPDFASDFRTELSLFCSRSQDGCHDPVDPWVESFEFIVTCPVGEDCSFVPDPEPGSNITQNLDSVELPALVRRANGDLYVVYRRLGEVTGNLVSRSSDNGQAWQIVATFDMPSAPDMIETSAETLVIIQACGSLHCAYTSGNGETWQEVSLPDFRTPHECTGNCFVHTESIVQTANGEFLLLYQFDADPATLGADIYATRSTDLQAWTAPVQVTDGEFGSKFGSTVVQRADGSFVAAYVSNPDAGIVVVTSDDGDAWTRADLLSSTTFANTTLELLIDGDTLRLFHTDTGTLKVTAIDAEGQVGTPLVIHDNIPFSADLLRFPDGSIGIVYALDLNNQRDLFFENLGVVPE